MVSEQRQKKRAARKKWRQLVRSFDLAAGAVCNARDRFVPVLEEHKDKLAQMRHYLKELPRIVDAAAPKLPKGMPRESQKLAKNSTYASAKNIVAEYRKFVNETTRRIDRRLKHPNRRFEIRAYEAGLDIRNVHKMQWMAHEYKKAKTDIAEKHKAALAQLDHVSEGLDIPFAEYRRKAGAYEKTRERYGNANELRLRTRQTFSKLAQRYSPKLVPPKPRP